MEEAKVQQVQEMELALEREARAYQGMGIKILSITGGFLGSLFVMAFIFMFLNDSSAASMVIGLLTLCVVIFVDKKVDNTVVDTACIGAYISAAVMIGYGVHIAFKNDNVTTLTAIVIAISVMGLTTSYMLNFISMLILCGSLFALVNINDVYGLLHVLVPVFALVYTLFSIYEAKMLASGRKTSLVYNPWRNALLCSFLMLLAYIAVDKIAGKHLNYHWISSVAIIGIYSFFLNRIVAYLGILEGKNRMLIYSGALLIMLMAVFSPAICGALLILLISFHTGHRFGLILSLIALIYFIGQFYYNLQYTLLVKSMIMFGTGVMFLIAWLILKKRLKSYE